MWACHELSGDKCLRQGVFLLCKYDGLQVCLNQVVATNKSGHYNVEPTGEDAHAPPQSAATSTFVLQLQDKWKAQDK